MPNKKNILTEETNPVVPEQTVETDPLLDQTVEGSHAAMADKLDQPGALEVEEMEESNELQSRRRATKEKLRESVTVESPSYEEGGVFEENAGLMALLRDSNLSPRHLRFCCSGVLILLLALLLIFGGVQTVQYFKDRPDRTPVVEEDKGDKEDEEDVSTRDFLDPSLVVGLMVGGAESQEDLGVGSGDELGEEPVPDDVLATYIVDFQAMYESMQTDVNQLLDASRDRQATFEDYSNELNFLVYTGRLNLEALQNESEQLLERLNERSNQKDLYEQRFFEKLQDLDAYGSVDNLDSFVEEAGTVAQIRAQYQARINLIFYYQALLVDMELRAKDLELNEEALVKGVQVIDVHGSDLNLIIDETQL